MCIDKGNSTKLRRQPMLLPMMIIGIGILTNISFYLSNKTQQRGTIRRVIFFGIHITRAPYISTLLPSPPYTRRTSDTLQCSVSSSRLQISSHTSHFKTNISANTSRGMTVGSCLPMHQWREFH